MIKMERIWGGGERWKKKILSFFAKLDILCRKEKY